MAKHYMIEDIAGTEHEAGHQKSHVLEAHWEDGTTGGASGKKFRPTGEEMKSG